MAQYGDVTLSDTTTQAEMLRCGAAGRKDSPRGKQECPGWSVILGGGEKGGLGARASALREEGAPLRGKGGKTFHKDPGNRFLALRAMHAVPPQLLNPAAVPWKQPQTGR